MRYLLCFIFPPLAVLACNKPGQAALNLILTCCLWLPGTLHALFVVSDTNANERTRVALSQLKNATHDKTASPAKAVRLWKNARLDVWEKYYGKPETITKGKDADGLNSLNDTPASYRWSIERLALTVAFTYHDGNEIKIDVEARDGKDPLTLPEAKTFASALGLPGPIDTSRNPTAAGALENHWQTWGSGNFVAYFDDTYPEATSFYFENSPR